MTSKIPDEAFEFYVGLGPTRSYKAVADHFGASKTGVAKKAERDNWAERLEAIERDVQKRGDARIADEIDDMRSRHLKTVRAMMGRAIKALHQFPLNSGMEAMRAAEMTIKLERLIMGEASERTETTVEDVTKREMRRWLKPKDGPAPDEPDLAGEG